MPTDTDYLYDGLRDARRSIAGIEAATNRANLSARLAGWDASNPTLAKVANLGHKPPYRTVAVRRSDMRYCRSPRRDPMQRCQSCGATETLR